MKLKNKLLPLVGVAAVCATAAPLALTSCKSTNTSDNVDLLTLYKPTIKMYCEEKNTNKTLTPTEVQEAYFGDYSKGGSEIDTNVIQERIKQDYLWSNAYSSYYKNSHYKGPVPILVTTNSSDGTGSIDKNEAKINYVKLGFEQVTLESVTHYCPVLSMQIEYNKQVKYTSNIKAKSHEATIKGVTTITNFPITISYYSSILDVSMWNVELDFGELQSEYMKSGSTIRGIDFSFSDVVSYAVTTTDTSTGESETNNINTNVIYNPNSIYQNESALNKFQQYVEGSNSVLTNISRHLNTLAANTYGHFTSYYLYGNGIKR